MNIAKTRRLGLACACETRFDDLTRQLYATDASIYQVAPLGVAFPRSSQEAAELIRAALNENTVLIPRGAGTGLAGGALGEGLVVDMARHNRQIREFNPEARTVRVGAGVVLDQLNAYLQPHGLCFGPDVATSSRATLGGMIANNSSGARTPLYGVTGDHVRSLEVVLSSGEVLEIGEDKPGLLDLKERIDGLLDDVLPLIESQLHRDVIKRWPGYGLDRYLQHGRKNLAHIFGGSEGTLGAVFSAELYLTPLPSEKALGLIFFDSVEEAMQATVELLDLEAAAIEHVDDVLFDQTRGQRAFQPARDLLKLDTQPCKSILIVEFYEHIQAKMAALEQKHLGQRSMVIDNPQDMQTVWHLRKQGLSLLTSRKGDAKPIAGIEDVAVPPSRLPEYVKGLYALMEPLGIEASFYGHAASGLLHVRPVLDLHRGEDIAKFRSLADGVADLTKTFKGALAAEHGVGMARTEYMEEQLGPELLGAMRNIKALLDPKNCLNPGKIFSDGRFHIDNNLRMGDGYRLDPPFEPVLAFAYRDKSFVGNLEQCNGNGACRKLTPAMCPTYIATGDDLMSPRGRANVIRAVLDGRLGDKDPLKAPELAEALDYCLSCKACKTECPSNVDIALMKAELQYAAQCKYGVSLAARMMSRVDLLGRVASKAPQLANRMQEWRLPRKILQQVAGITMRRPLPAFDSIRFSAYWDQYERQPRATRTGLHCSDVKRGQVILWDDTFVEHYDHQIGAAALQVLEAAGFEVLRVTDHDCCGRPAFSMGRLDVARKMGAKNLARLQAMPELPVIFLEPSSYSMFQQDYIELGLPGAEDIAKSCTLFEHFMDALLAEEPEALAFDDHHSKTAVHVHCHAKSLSDVGPMLRLARRIPNNTVEYLDVGCCGMAGSFGAMEQKYDLSVQVAQPLVGKIEGLEPDVCVVASGTSCRHQITHLTDARPLHMAELMAKRIAKAHP